MDLKSETYEENLKVMKAYLRETEPAFYETEGSAGYLVERIWQSHRYLLKLFALEKLPFLILRLYSDLRVPPEKREEALEKLQNVDQGVETHLRIEEESGTVYAEMRAFCPYRPISETVLGYMVSAARKCLKGARYCLTGELQDPESEEEGEGRAAFQEYSLDACRERLTEDRLWSILHYFLHRESPEA